MALTRVKSAGATGGYLSSVATSNLPAGTVVQTVFGTHETQVSNTTGTFADTGLTATITPTSSSNKILITVMQNGVYKDGSAAAGCQIQLLRGSTAISQLSKRAGGDNGTGTAATMSIGTVGASILDSPNTTSATTYKLQGRTYSGDSRSFCINKTLNDTSVNYHHRGESRIIAMEVAA